MRDRNSYKLSLPVRCILQYSVLILLCTSVLVVYLNSGNLSFYIDFPRIPFAVDPNSESSSSRHTDSIKELYYHATTEPLSYTEANITRAFQFTTATTVRSPRDIDKIPKNVAWNTSVLVVAYLRGGSSFTADILQQSPEVFYLFEPLRAFISGHYKKTQVCDGLENKCRLPKTWRENPVNVVRNLINLYRCDFRSVPREMLSLLMIKHLMSRAQTQFKNCTTHERFDKCLDEFEDNCRSKKKVIKTIRLTMEAVEEVLQRVPNLKVIHLLRDPRGALLSRIRGMFVPRAHVAKAANGTCSQMFNDITWSIQLMNMYPGQIKTVMYEAIAENPFRALRSLHNFIGTPITKDMERYVQEHTMAGKEGNGYYRTIRANSSQTAHNWRRILSWEEVKAIDSVCKKFYNVVGYNPIPEKELLRNMSYKTRNPVSRMFGSFI